MTNSYPSYYFLLCSPVSCMLGIGDVVLLSKQKKAQMLGIGGDVVLLSKQKKAQMLGIGGNVVLLSKKKNSQFYII